jgi:hypothetical protein
MADLATVKKGSNSASADQLRELLRDARYQRLAETRLTLNP